MQWVGSLVCRKKESSEEFTDLKKEADASIRYIQDLTVDLRRKNGRPTSIDSMIDRIKSTAKDGR